MSALPIENNKILVCITAQQNSHRLIDKGYEEARLKNAELHVLHVTKGTDILSSTTSTKILQDLFSYSGKVGATVHGVCGNDIFPTIRAFIAKHSITHAIFGETANSIQSIPQMDCLIKDALDNVEVVILKRTEEVPSIV